MIELPGFAKSVAAAIAGMISLIWDWVNGAESRKRKKQREQLAELDGRAAEAKRNKNEKLYNQIMAERRRLLDSWLC